MEFRLGVSSFEAYCDMETNGGGWTLVMNLDSDNGSAKGKILHFGHHQVPKVIFQMH